MQTAIQLPEQIEAIRFLLDIMDAFLGDSYLAGHAEHTLNKRRWVLVLRVPFMVGASYQGRQFLSKLFQCIFSFIEVVMPVIDAF